jgi:hypothetical protein
MAVRPGRQPGARDLGHVGYALFELSELVLEGHLVHR